MSATSDNSLFYSFIYLADTYAVFEASQVVIVVKNLPPNAGDARDVGSILRLGRSHGGRHGNPFHYSSWRTPRTEEPGVLWSIAFPRQALFSDCVAGLLISIQLPHWPPRSPVHFVVYLFVYVTQASRIHILFVCTEGRAWV